MTDEPVASLPASPVPPLPAVRAEAACANCGAVLQGKYCVACGQHHEPHVHSVAHFAHEAFESITHADSRVWRTLWLLVSRPGRLTREFFDGRRVSYLPPFRLYLVISVFFFLVASLPDQAGNAAVDINLDDEPTAERVASLDAAATALESAGARAPGAAQAAATVRAEAAREQAVVDGKAPADETAGEKKGGLREQNVFTEFCKEFEKPDPKAGRNYANLRELCLRSTEDHGKGLFESIVHNIPHAMFVFLPLLALVMKLLYWRPRRYYVEHLLFLIHNHAFVFLALAISSLLGRIPVVGEYLGLLELAIWLYMIWYVFRAMRVYYAQSRGLTFGKYVTIGFAYIMTSFLVLLLTAIVSALTL